MTPGLVKRPGLAVLLLLAAAGPGMHDAAAQAGRGGDGRALTARAVAPVDLTGTWVSVVTEDWAWRMRTPPRGDYASVPLNEAGRRVADAWDASQDGSCLAHGAPALLRLPGRVRISWADDDTLRLEADYGRQTRLLRFSGSAETAAAPSLQGTSRARWLVAEQVTGSGATAGILTTELARAAWGSLEVVTTGLAAGWLRRNGVPYSDEAVLTEYFDRYSDGEDEWFTVTTIVEDPAYLTEPFVTSSNFKRERDDSRWNPADCRPAP